MTRVGLWQMLGALSQLEVSSDIWEQVLQQALDILPELVDEPLAALMSFVFKAATESQQLLRAVCTIDLLRILAVYIYCETF